MHQIKVWNLINHPSYISLIKTPPKKNNCLKKIIILLLVGSNLMHDSQFTHTRYNT